MSYLVLAFEWLVRICTRLRSLGVRLIDPILLSTYNLLLAGRSTRSKRSIFLLDTSTDSSDTATPQRIPKTVVFVDGRTAVQHAAAYIQSALLTKTSGCAVTNQPYSLDAGSSVYCLSTVVEVFTAHVPRHDRGRSVRRIQEGGLRYPCDGCNNLTRYGYEYPGH